MRRSGDRPADGLSSRDSRADPLQSAIDPIDSALRGLTKLDATKWQYTNGVRDASRIDPSAWTHDQALIERPGNSEIQLDLFQAFFRDRLPPTLIVWGKNDKIFPAEGAHPYLRDLPKAELHLFDTGHFALEDKGDEIARLMRDFLDRKVSRK
jgi:pimeloyl-ACP methyl ester carboxylesterase